MPNVYDHNGIRYIKIAELTPLEQEIVHLEMIGSTCPVIPGSDPIGCLYAHDYVRIERHVKQCTPLYREAENALLNQSVLDVMAKGKSLGL